MRWTQCTSPDVEDEESRSHQQTYCVYSQKRRCELLGVETLFTETLRQGALPRLVGTLRHGRSSIRTILPIAVALACFLFLLYGFAFGQGIKFWEAYSRAGLSPQAAAAVSRCRSIQAKPAPPLDFAKRSQSDRFAPGTKPILLKNAKIWTGEKNGTEVVHADILLDKGLIKGIGQTNLAKILKSYKDDIEVIDVKNAWVTPG